VPGESPLALHWLVIFGLDLLFLRRIRIIVGCASIIAGKLVVVGVIILVGSMVSCSSSFVSNLDIVFFILYIHVCFPLILRFEVDDISRLLIRILMVMRGLLVLSR
jgi:hypothetical protein